LKWSDGQPATTADILFWWEDMVNDPEHLDDMPEFGKAGGKIAEFVALDETTLEIRYTIPSPLTAMHLACRVNGFIGYIWIIPSHVFKPLHPKYNSEIENYEQFRAKLWDIYRPVLDPWMVTDFKEDQYATFERNPYYYAVDTEGNQLPYIDGIDETFCPSRDTFILRCAQGSVDLAVMTYNLTTDDIPSLLVDQSNGNYDVRFWDSGTGVGQGFRWNYDCRDDALRALYRTPQFKRAMSHALDRPTIHRIVYYDTGFITTGTTSPKALEFNFNAEAQRRFQRWRDSYIEYNPEKAKALLDEIGMLDVDGDGWREMPDGSKYDCRIFHFAESGMGDYVKVLEIASKNFQDIGLNVILSPHGWGDDNDWFNGKDAIQCVGGGNDAPTLLLYPYDFINVNQDRWAPLCGNLFYYTGTEKENSELDVSPWERQPPRYHKDDPDYKGTPVEKLHNLYRQAIIEVDQLKRIEYVWEMIDIHVEEGPFFIGTVANIPRIIIVSNQLENVPTHEQLKLGGYCDPWIVPYPAITNPETYFFKT
jgi:peptide/nickel transport system substrate-binding protein